MTPILLTLLLILISFIAYKSFTESGQTDIETKNLPPGPRRWPFIGSYLHLLWIDFYRPHVALMKMKDFYQSPVISFGMGSFNCVVANDYKTCKEVFTNPDLQGRVPAYPALVRTFGKPNGFFSDDGPRWLQIKRKTLRALRDFGFGRRSDFFEAVMNEEVQSLVKYLRQKNCQPVLIPEAFFHTNLNLINQIAHGFRYSENDRETLTELGKIAIRVITETDGTGRLIAIWPWIRHVFPGLSGYERLVETSEYFQEFLRASYERHQHDFGGKVSQDVVDFMIMNQKRFPDWTVEEILTSLMDLTFPNAAVATVIAFTLGHLSYHPDKLKKCQEEIDEVVGKDRSPNLDDRPRLKMVEACIRETMRLKTLTPLGLAHRATADTTLGGYHVPLNSVVITNLYAMNLDPNVFDEPEAFKPERFLHKDNTLPFGIAKRVCMGETFSRQNMFMIVANILQNFDLETACPLDESRFLSGVATVPNPDFSLRFVPRT